MAAVTANKGALQSMQSKLRAMGGVSSAVIGEPMAAQTGMVAIIPSGGRIDELTLNSPREIHAVTLRRYHSALDEPRDNIEFSHDQWRADVLDDIFGDFELGGAVAYALPVLTTWEYGYQQVGNTMFRLLDLSISYRVDDRSTFVA